MSLLTDAPSVAVPRFLTAPPAMTSAGQEAVELAASAGLVLDAWQAAMLDVALGERDDKAWAAREVALICPRQNGKGAILTAVELAGLFLFDEQLILHSAHEFKTASEAFRKIWELIESTPDLDRLVYRKLQNNNDMSIELRTGQRLRFVARTGGSGRGFSGDRIILDEAFNLPDKAIAALSFTMAARPNPQVWFTSSAPMLDQNSAVLRRLCQRGREGAKSLVYVEYAADPAASLDDPAAWASANPGFPERIGVEAIEMERGLNTDVEFARERLGIWSEGDDIAWRVVPADAWRACERVDHKPSGDLRYAVDADVNAAGDTWVSFAASDGTHIELVTPLDAVPGTSWVLRAVAARRDSIGELVIDPTGPAGVLVDPLEAAGVRLRKVKPQEFGQACAQFLDAVVDLRVRHIDQPALEVAARGAARRDVGDGAWKWSRKGSQVDISPLVACTLARWAAAAAPPPRVTDFYTI